MQQDEVSFIAKSHLLPIISIMNLELLQHIFSSLFSPQVLHSSANQHLWPALLEDFALFSALSHQKGHAGMIILLFSNKLISKILQGCSVTHCAASLDLLLFLWVSGQLRSLMDFLSAIKDSVNQSMKDQTFMPENQIFNLKSPFILVKFAT